MIALLGTHVVLWAAILPERLSGRARSVVEETQNELYVSAATAWEISTKVRLGKLVQAERLEADFEEWMKRMQCAVLPIDVDVALRAGRLTGLHGDPFDRMIAAQALALDVPVISADAKLDGFGVRRIW